MEGFGLLAIGLGVGIAAMSFSGKKSARQAILKEVSRFTETNTINITTETGESAPIYTLLEAILDGGRENKKLSRKQLLPLDRSTLDRPFGGRVHRAEELMRIQHFLGKDTCGFMGVIKMQ